MKRVVAFLVGIIFFQTLPAVSKKTFDLSRSVSECLENNKNHEHRQKFFKFCQQINDRVIDFNAIKIYELAYMKGAYYIFWDNVLWDLLNHKAWKSSSAIPKYHDYTPCFYVIEDLQKRLGEQEAKSTTDSAIRKVAREFIKQMTGIRSRL